MNLLLIIVFGCAISIAIGLIIGYTIPSNQEFQLMFDDNRHLKKGLYEYTYLHNGLIKQNKLYMLSETLLKLNVTRKTESQIIYIDEFPYCPIKLILKENKATFLLE